MKKTLGIVVLLATLAAGGFGGWQFYQRQNSIIVVFDEAKGLQPGAPVQMGGIAIGKVRDLAIAEDGIDVTILLDREAQRRLSSTSLFVIDANPGGEKPVQVLAKDGAPGGIPLTARTRIRGVNSVVLWQLSDLSKQIGQLLDSQPVRDFAKNLNAFEKEMDEAIRNFDDRAMQKRLEEKVKQLAAEFEQVLHDADAKQKLEQMSLALNRLSAAIARIGDSEEAKRLGQAVDDLGRKVQKELAGRK